MKYFLFTAFFSLFIINCNSEQNEVQDVITDDVLNCVPKTWYKDSDGDGFGDPSISVLSCSQPEGYTLIKEEVVVSDDLIFIPGEQKPFLINETNAGYGFYLFTPAEYTETKEKGYPLLIHLHGGGARGQGDAEDTMKGVIYDGPPSLVKNSKWNPPVPMIMATPQSPHLWDAERLHNFISFLIKNVNVDASRIYMTGFSMGGRGTFDYVSTYGDASYTAAVVPIAGWSVINEGEPFKNVPLWAFHGGADPSVPLSGSINMVNAINSSAPTTKAKLTVFPGVNHFSWPRVYDSSGMNSGDVNYDAFQMTIYDWMLQYSK